MDFDTVFIDRSFCKKNTNAYYKQLTFPGSSNDHSFFASKCTISGSFYSERAYSLHGCKSISKFCMTQLDVNFFIDLDC